MEAHERYLHCCAFEVRFEKGRDMDYGTLCFLEGGMMGYEL